MSPSTVAHCLVLFLAISACWSTVNSIAARRPLRPPFPPPSPPKPKPALPQTTLDQLVGTWVGTCTQQSVLIGLVQEGLKVISYPPPGASAKCAPKGLDVHYNFTATYTADGSYTFSRTEIKAMFRSVHYAYGPAVSNAMGTIVGPNQTFYGSTNCISISGLAGQPAETKLLVQVTRVRDAVDVKSNNTNVTYHELYTEQGLYDSKTNQLTNVCDVSDKNKANPGLQCGSANVFGYRCYGTRLVM